MFSRCPPVSQSFCLSVRLSHLFSWILKFLNARIYFKFCSYVLQVNTTGCFFFLFSFKNCYAAFFFGNWLGKNKNFINVSFSTNVAEIWFAVSLCCLIRKSYLFYSIYAYKTRFSGVNFENLRILFFYQRSWIFVCSLLVQF